MRIQDIDQPGDLLLKNDAYLSNLSTSLYNIDISKILRHRTQHGISSYIPFTTHEQWEKVFNHNFVVDIFVSAPSAISWIKLDRKYCDDRYGSFSTQQLAKDACSKDTNCQGVYDQGCDSGADNIYLCRTSATYLSSISSCIFHKNENGKYFKSFYFIDTLLITLY